MVPKRVVGLTMAAAFALSLAPLSDVLALSASANVRVTVDNGSNGDYVSADQLGGTGSYSDGVLTRCGSDKRMQNEPTLAIDPRNTDVWIAGANEYCTVPTAGDAWAGYYRSTNGGSTWTDSLLPGYKGDTSDQGTSSPLGPLVAGGALAAGDPVQAWDANGRLFYMGNNFNRGTENGVSGSFRNNIGSIWVATYGPSDPNDNSTDGAKYLRTVVLAKNTFGIGQANDKTELAVDRSNGNVYAAWSSYHGGGCNEIDFSRSTDHGVTFSMPVKLSSAICSNQGPSIAVGGQGTVFVAWETFSSSGNGAAFVSSSNGGKTFSKARIVATYSGFTSGTFTGNGGRECGDTPFDCPSGFTFPRFDLAMPFLVADTSHGTLVMAFDVAQSDGQGQVEFTGSSDNGATWSDPAVLDSSSSGHQFFPFLAYSNGRISAIWYDSRGDPDYLATRPPCNNGSGQTSACLNVRYATSTDGGSTWSGSIQVTDTPTNPNYEQFGGRHVPFFGDYITVDAVGSTIGAVWTDQRDTVPASDASGDDDGADVAGDPETGGGCTSALTTCFDGTGGLDQNIYVSTITVP